jgi:hypothetical protein
LDHFKAEELAVEKHLACFLGLSMALVCSASCDYIEDDGSFEPLLPGIIYNSNDGDCAFTGAAMDFYFDSEFVATVQPGRSTDAFSTLGDHQIQAFVAGTDTLVAKFDFYVNKGSWVLWAGCVDGTHP